MKIKFYWVDREYYFAKRRDAIVRKIVWKLPNRLVMWCFYRVIAHATSGKYGNTEVPTLTSMDAIERYCVDKKIR